MDAKIRRRFERYAKSGLTWSPTKGGRRPLVAWDDDLLTDLGPDKDGRRFAKIAEHMMSGRYYPSAVIEFFRPSIADLEVGERVLQKAALFGVPLWSMVEIFLAEREANACRIGYVTTSRHHGRGIWQAHLLRAEGRLSLRVASTAGPQSVWFWIGLPLARATQLRARRIAIERFLAMHPDE